METEKHSEKLSMPVICNDPLTFEIPFRLPSLNEYINACRTNPHVGAKLKRDTEAKIRPYMQHVPRMIVPVKIRFHWVEDTKRRDLDNIAAGKKFILDAMVEAGVLENDNWKWVQGFQDVFSFGSKARVLVTLLPQNM